MSETELGQDPTYAYRPSLVGAPWIFRLGEDALHWESGRRSGRVEYSQIKRVRLLYRPGTMQPHRFVTEIRSQGTPKLTIASTSWRTMTDIERLDRPYRDFVIALHQRLAGHPIELIAGLKPPVFLLALVLFVVTALGMAAVAIRTLQEGAGVAALLICAFVALFVWQIANYVWRNRPVRYVAPDVPESLLPRAT
jgi:hypothetical protein